MLTATAVLLRQREMVVLSHLASGLLPVMLWKMPSNYR